MPERIVLFDPQGELLAQSARILLDFYDGDPRPIEQFGLKGTEQKQGVIALVEGDTVIAACIYEMAIQEHNGGTRKVVLLRAMKGISDSLRVRWKLHLTEFQEFARSQNCEYAIIQGRAAWLRLNWDTIQVVVGTSLNLGEQQ